MGKRKPMGQVEYLASGGTVCPFCGGSDISGDSIEVDAGRAWQEMGCNECEHSWHDVYQLSGWTSDDETEASDPFRELMYQWHGGEDSPLYAAASSGLVSDVESLAYELKKCAVIATHPDTTPFDDASGTDASEEAALLRKYAADLPTIVGAPFHHPADRSVYWPLPWATVPAGAKPYMAGKGSDE